MNASPIPKHVLSNNPPIHLPPIPTHYKNPLLSLFHPSSPPPPPPPSPSPPPPPSPSHNHHHHTTPHPTTTPSCASSAKPSSSATTTASASTGASSTTARTDPSTRPRARGVATAARRRCRADGCVRRVVRRRGGRGGGVCDDVTGVFFSLFFSGHQRRDEGGESQVSWVEGLIGL